MKKKFLLILICVLALIVALTVGVVIYQKSIPKEYIRLNEYTAIAIHNDLVKNPTSGSEKWRDTPVMLIGTVDNFTTVSDSTFYMHLRYADRECSISIDTTKKELLKLSIGDRVKVTGELYAWWWDGEPRISIDADEIIKQ